MTLLPTALPPTTTQCSPDQYAHQLATPSSICLTGVMFSEGTLDVTRSLDHHPTSDTGSKGDLVTDGEQVQQQQEQHRRVVGTIRYRVFRPRQMKMLPSPLVVLHGGPGVPSNYLMTLVNVITDRTVIFYDQLGCGRSSRVMEKEAYSVQYCVDDLRALLKHWDLNSFHLFGHSFGGIIAFEYLKQEQESEEASKCVSLILSSVPTETKIVEDESKRLLQQIHDCPPEEVAVAFSHMHECRKVPTPLALLDAYGQAGTIWRGISAIPTYKAQLLPTTETSASSIINTPCCILRGQYDFVTDKCIEGWQELFHNAQCTILAGCSHHALLENEQLYGDVILAFLEDYDL